MREVRSCDLRSKGSVTVTTSKLTAKRWWRKWVLIVVMIVWKAQWLYPLSHWLRLDSLVHIGESQRWELGVRVNLFTETIIHQSFQSKWTLWGTAGRVESLSEAIAEALMHMKLYLIGRRILKAKRSLKKTKQRRDKKDASGNITPTSWEKTLETWKKRDKVLPINADTYFSRRMTNLALPELQINAAS